MRKLDIIGLDDGDHPEPVMPSACETGGCGGPADAPGEPIEIGGPVSVNGTPIEEAAIAREMQHHPAANAQDAWLAAARALAVRELLRLEAGADEEGAEEAIGALLERQIDPAQPNEAECRRAYDADPSRFAAAALTEAAHILIEPEEDTRGGWNRARHLADRLIAEIAGDVAAFSAAAREYSGCPSGQQDGSLGQLKKGDLTPPIEAALDALDEGQMAQQPVRSRHGWHLLYVHRRIAGRSLPYEIVRSRIADMLEARSWSIKAGRYIAALTRKYRVQGIDIAGPTA